jgi:hypothetical protein
MTHNPGDAPVPDPDDRRASAIAPPDADVQTPTDDRPTSDATASDGGHSEVPASSTRRPEPAAPDVGWPEAAASGGSRPDVATSDVGRPEMAESEMRRPGAAASEADRPEVAAPRVAASDWTASDAADSADPRGGAPETDLPEGCAPGDGPAAPGTGRDAQPVEDAPAAGREASAGRPAAPVVPGGGAPATPASGPSPTRRPAEYRSVPDPYETTRLPVTPTPDPGFADTPPRPAGDPSAAPPNRPGGTRIGSALFFDDRLADGQSTTYPRDAEDASGRTLVDDAPTEAMAVVETGGRHRAEPGGNTDADSGTEWRPPRQTSRLTTVLVIALLVAIGFLAGVFVGRSAAPAPSGEQPRPAATSPARPGALG